MTADFEILMFGRDVDHLACGPESHGNIRHTHILLSNSKVCPQHSQQKYETNTSLDSKVQRHVLVLGRQPKSCLHAYDLIGEPCCVILLRLEVDSSLELEVRVATRNASSGRCEESQSNCLQNFCSSSRIAMRCGQTQGPTISIETTHHPI